MSEYQYYEFVAADGPISDEGMRYAESCSSRADVSRFRWRNEYNFGDFHGSVETLLKYYDAHFYIANWGTVRFALAFPEDCMNPEAIQPFLRGNNQYDEILSVKRIDGRYIIWWERNEEEGWGWTEGEGIIERLISIREEMMRGDYRALFLGWLADFYPDDWLDTGNSGILMPLIPAGLDGLTDALQVLIEQFPVDLDALAVTSGQSQKPIPDRIPIASVLDKLSAPEMKALLQRVAEGDGSRVMSELNRLTYPPIDVPAGDTMTCVDFATKVIQVREARLEAEARTAAAERNREIKARKRHLESVIKRADVIWAGLDPLMDRKIAAAYDDVAEQLKELYDAYKQANKDAEFQDMLAAFRKLYARRSSMMSRIKDL